MKDHTSKQIKAAVKLLHDAGYVLIPPFIGYCQLPECGARFVIPRGSNGAPRTKFCSRQHMLANHARTAADRVRRSRAQTKNGALQERRT